MKTLKDFTSLPTLTTGGLKAGLNSTILNQFVEQGLSIDSDNLPEKIVITLPNGTAYECYTLVLIARALLCFTEQDLEWIVSDASEGFINYMQKRAASYLQAKD
jgi:hypothetical protein